MPTDHRALHRDALAGANPNEILLPDLFDRQLDLSVAAHDTRDLGLQIEQPLHRLRASRLDDQRQPLGEDVIGGDHDRDREELRGWIFGSVEHEAYHAPGNPGECPNLQQHMLVEDAAPQRLHGHVEDVPPDTEDQRQRQGTDYPRSSRSQIAREVEVKQTARHDGQAAKGGGGSEEAFRPQHQEHQSAEAQTDEGRQKADPAYLGIGDDRDGRDAERHGKNETVALTDKLAFLFLERPQFARVVYRVADVAQRTEQLLGAHHLRVVLDERLFVG